MARQTTLIAARQPASSGVFEGVSSFGNDLVTLAGLQARLAAHDARDSFEQAAPALAALAITALMAFGGTVVIGIGVAFWVDQATELSTPEAFLLVGSATLVLAGLIAGLAIWRLGHCFTSFHRTHEEFQRNLAWARTVLAHRGRPVESPGVEGDAKAQVRQRVGRVEDGEPRG